MSNFAEWKADVEKEYEEWEKKQKVELSRTENGKILDYFDAKCKENLLLDIIWNKFLDKYKECKKKEKGASEKAKKLLFVRCVLQNRIEWHQNGNGEMIVGIDIDLDWIRKETNDQTGLYENIFEKGNFPMEEGNELWIDFCSAFHKYFGLFDSWDEINVFCTKCCKNKKGDNFLCVRKIDDLCTFYTIINNKSGKYKKELIQKVKTYILKQWNSSETQSKSEEESEEKPTAYTMEMLNDIKKFCGMREEEFCEEMLRYSFRHSIWSPKVTNTKEVAIFDRLIHLTAIQNMYDLFKAPDILASGETKTETAEGELEFIFNWFDNKIGEENRKKLNNYIRNLLKGTNQTTNLKRRLWSCFIPCLKGDRLIQEFSLTYCSILAKAIYEFLSQKGKGDSAEFNLKDIFNEDQRLCLQEELAPYVYEDLAQILSETKNNLKEGENFDEKLYGASDGKLTKDLCRSLVTDLCKHKLTAKEIGKNLSDQSRNSLWKSTFINNACEKFSKVLICYILKSDCKDKQYFSKQIISDWGDCLKSVVDQMIDFYIPSSKTIYDYNCNTQEENETVRYFAILMKMWQIMAWCRTTGRTVSVQTIIIRIDTFLKNCYLRELDEVHDVFDWFVIKAIEYEAKLRKEGACENVSGIDTLLKYLCEG